MTTATQLPPSDISEILKHIPHRYPFLLIDRVLAAPEYAARAQAVGVEVKRETGASAACDRLLRFAEETAT